MTKEQLTAKAKLRIRKTSSDMLGEDVGQLIEVAFVDLKRIGVHSSCLDEADIKDPLIIEAILLYRHANFGNPDNQTQLLTSYNAMCTKIKGGGYYREVNKTIDQKEPNRIPGDGSDSIS